MGTLESLADLQLPEVGTLYCSQADVKDCFHECLTPPGLQEYFGLLSVTVQEALEAGFTHVADVPLRELPREAMVDPVITTFPMGFTWSFWFIQQLHEQKTMEGSCIRQDDLFRDGFPAPIITEDRVQGLVYCDNFNAFSLL